MTDKTTDPVAALVKLRAKIVRLAHEVDGLADLDSIIGVRTLAPTVAEKLRLAAMTQEMVDASKRNCVPAADEIKRLQVIIETLARSLAAVKEIA